MTKNSHSVPQSKLPRRRFLAAASAAGAAAAIGPSLVHAADKSGSRLPILGTGAYTYEAAHNWGRSPSISIGATRMAWSSTSRG